MHKINDINKVLNINDILFLINLFNLNIIHNYLNDIEMKYIQIKYKNLEFLSSLFIHVGDDRDKTLIQLRNYLIYVGKNL